jgi:hypothetical protein
VLPVFVLINSNYRKGAGIVTTFPKEDSNKSPLNFWCLLAAAINIRAESAGGVFWRSVAEVSGNPHSGGWLGNS